MISYISGSGTNLINYTSLQQKNNSISADELFSKLSGKSDSTGNDGTISKNQVESYLLKARTEPLDGLNKPQEDFIDKLLKNWSNIFAGKDSINKDDLENAIIFLKPKTSQEIKLLGYKKEDSDDYYYDGKASLVSASFSDLALAVGAVNDKISKEQLLFYLQSLMSAESGMDHSREIALVKNLIAKFDTISGGSDYITSLSGINDAQDVNTITLAQVTPPFDIAV